jgi:glycosyltransferase involved in cell wall biosynthesis
VSATVAIVLSNFNQAAYLRQSLSAICEQTRPADDVIVIDDGSTDNSVDVIKDFVARYPTIRWSSQGTSFQESIAFPPLVTADYPRVGAIGCSRRSCMAVLKSARRLCFSFAENADTAHVFNLADLPEFLPPAALQQRMRRAYLPMKRNAVVVRRSALLAMGDYPSDLELDADSFAYTVVALRYGACVVPETVALIQSHQESYSERGRRPNREVEVLRILDRLATPELREGRSGVAPATSPPGAFPCCDCNSSALVTGISSSRMRGGPWESSNADDARSHNARSNVVWLSPSCATRSGRPASVCA